VTCFTRVVNALIVNVMWIVRRAVSNQSFNTRCKVNTRRFSRQSGRHVSWTQNICKLAMRRESSTD